MVFYSNVNNKKSLREMTSLVTELRAHFPVDSEDANKIIFVIATNPEVIMPIQTEFKSNLEGIQMLFLPAKIISQDVVLDTLKTHLPRLKLIEDLSLKKYVKFVKNSETEFKINELDSQCEKERKESLSRIFTPQRF